MLRTTRAYFDVLYAQDNLYFTQAERKSTGLALDRAKARFNVGIITITDLNEAQAGYDQTLSNEIRAQNELDNAKARLREIIGEFESSLDQLAEDIPLNSPEPSNIQDWATRAQESNLSIIAAQNDVELAKKNIELQFSGHLPTLDLVTWTGFNDTNRPLGIRSESHVVGAQVNIPLFQGGGVNSRVRQARFELESTQERLDRQRRIVRRQIEEAYRGVLAAMGEVKALKTAVMSSQSALKTTQAGFDVGTRTMIDVLASERNLYAARRNYARARYDFIVQSLSLKYAASLLQAEDLEWVNRLLARE
jgi:outer membrane protein